MWRFVTLSVNFLRIVSHQPVELLWSSAYNPRGRRHRPFIRSAFAGLLPLEVQGLFHGKHIVGS